MSTEPAISLRPVTDDDRELLLAAYAASREIELSVVPWDDAQKRSFVEHQLDAQTRHYRDEYPRATHDIIMFGERPAGRIYVDRGEDTIAILDMSVLNEFRRRGIATSLVTALTEEAAAAGKSVRVFVEVYNPSQRLFAALGFVETANDGVNIRFEWRGTLK